MLKGDPVEDRTKLALIAIRKILRASETNSKRLMRETGLTPSQLVFMQILDEQLEQTAGYVAARMGITQATTTVVLQKLESAGYIARRRGDKDRRQALLSLTEAGRRLLISAPDASHVQFQSGFSALKDWEQMSLIASLERVAEMLDGCEDDAAAVLDHKIELSEG
jgi:DNA-binding MarR family transcriptional regulator